MKKIWTMRKNDSAVSPVIATILMVAITVVLAAVLYVMVLGLGTTGTITPTIGTNKGTNATYTTWTVSAISGGASILKTDVYVQVKDANGTFQVQTVVLAKDLAGSPAAPVGGHFSYSPAASGNYISVGDVFGIDKAHFKQGSTVTLVTSGAAGQYCVLSV